MLTNLQLKLLMLSSFKLNFTSAIWSSFGVGRRCKASITSLLSSYGNALIYFSNLSTRLFVDVELLLLR